MLIVAALLILQIVPRMHVTMQIKLLLWLQFASLIDLGVCEGNGERPRLAQTLWAVVDSVRT